MGRLTAAAAVAIVVFGLGAESWELGLRFEEWPKCRHIGLARPCGSIRRFATRRFRQPWASLPHAHNFRHFEKQWFARHSLRHLKPSRAKREHSEGTGGRSMAIGADECLPWNAKSLHMHRMTHAVPFPAGLNHRPNLRQALRRNR